MEDDASGSSPAGDGASTFDAGAHLNGAEGLVSLPDDALLHVLGFLDTQSLLQSRGVCRRLRDAALHPHLWRKRRIDFDGWTQDKYKWVAAATLRVAPCLGRLSLCGGDVLRELLVSTSCAISELDALKFYSSDPVYVAEALARQADLGRLKAVSLPDLWASCKQIRTLLNQVLHTQGLTSLAVRGSSWDFPGCDWLPAGRAVPASLQRLEYSLQDGPPSFHGTLLRWHAATLEVVHFSMFEPPVGTAALLAALPRLRELQCPILEDMPALLQCPALKSLHLHCVDMLGEEDEFLRGSLLHGVQQFLRQATGRLETLTLSFQEDNVDEWYPVSKNATNLLLCLAGPGGAPSALLSLRLTYGGVDAQEPQPQLEPLASVLHRLENLVRLDLGGPPSEEFFDAMDGRVLPRLEHLRVALLSVDWCPHDWAHGDEPRRLLAKYPRLHIELDSLHEGRHLYCCPEEDDCHAFFCEDGGSVCTLFSHPEGEPCVQEHAENEMHIDS